MFSFFFIFIFFILPVFFHFVTLYLLKLFFAPNLLSYFVHLSTYSSIHLYFYLFILFIYLSAGYIYLFTPSLFICLITSTTIPLSIYQFNFRSIQLSTLVSTYLPTSLTYFASSRGNCWPGGRRIGVVPTCTENLITR